MDRSRARNWFWRLLAYVWASPSTLVGMIVVVACLPSGCKFRRINGALEVTGRGVRWMLRTLIPLPGGAAAITLGHIIVGRSSDDLSRCRYHEHVHVRQAERWGPLFIPAYLVLALWTGIGGRRPYLDHPFEREAFLAERMHEQEGKENYV